MGTLNIWLATFSSVQLLSCVRLWDTMDCSTPGFPVHHQLLELARTHVHRVGKHLILCYPLLILPSIFPSIRVFQFFASSGQSIGASVSVSVLPLNIQDWFPLGLTGLISSQSKELLSLQHTVLKHQFLGSQVSLWSNCHIHTWLLEKAYLWLDGTLLAK